MAPFKGRCLYDVSCWVILLRWNEQTVGPRCCQCWVGRWGLPPRAVLAGAHPNPSLGPLANQATPSVGLASPPLQLHHLLSASASPIFVPAPSAPPRLPAGLASPMAATAAVAIHQFAECITCHAWSPDQSSNALPPSSPPL